MDATPKTQALPRATTPTGDSQGEEAPLSPDELRKLDAYWRASNYLSVGQIYLLDNALLKDPLKREHIKPRLLGHWGTSPGLNMLYVHLNRVIKKDDLNMIYVIGPGHGGPSLVAHAYLEGTYSDVYPEISAGKYRVSIRFMRLSDVNTRNVQAGGSIDFRLQCCLLSNH